MSRKKIILTAIMLLSLTFIFSVKAEYASAEEKNKTIYKGVFIDDVDVSGMTKEEAKAAVEDYVAGLQNKGIAIMAGDDIVYSTMGELGYTDGQNDNVDEAMSLGRAGNLIKRYKDIKDIEQGKVLLPLTFTYDKAKIDKLVSVDVSAFNVAPVNATVSLKNGKLVYTDHVVGSKVNVDQTVKLIEDTIAKWNHQDIIVNAVMEDEMPIYTKDLVEQCDTVLGTFTTDYSSSSEDRAANLDNGARLVNNTVLYPGDEFSAYEHLTPFTAENGYHVAGAYLNGIVIDSVGGGACQVTTTLYNAVLGAELEVTQRQPHSMTISYVDLSRDAAIAGTYKDFKFKNNTDIPILITSKTINRKITFTIYGHETRDVKNRKVKYVTKVLSKTNPSADVVTKDPSQPTTYKKVTQSAHIGYKAQLWKVVYENDKEVSRTLVNTSTYSAAPQYITIGTKKVEEDNIDPEGNKGTQTDTKNQENSADSKPIYSGSKTNPDKPADNQETGND